MKKILLATTILFFTMGMSSNAAFNNTYLKSSIGLNLDTNHGKKEDMIAEYFHKFRSILGTGTISIGHMFNEKLGTESFLGYSKSDLNIGQFRSSTSSGGALVSDERFETNITLGAKIISERITLEGMNINASIGSGVSLKNLEIHRMIGDDEQQEKQIIFSKKLYQPFLLLGLAMDYSFMDSISIGSEYHCHVFTNKSYEAKDSTLSDTRGALDESHFIPEITKNTIIGTTGKIAQSIITSIKFPF